MPISFLLLALAVQQPSLIVNGSFEQGPPAGRYVNLVRGTSTVTGWVVTGEAIDYIGTLWKGSQGQHSIDLDGSAPSTTTPRFGHGGIAQTFATTPGAQYQVSFDLAGNPYAPPQVKPLRVSAAGQSVDLSFDGKGKSPTSMGWVSKSWAFTAKDTATTLEFRSLTTSPETGYGAVIDNVAVTKVDPGQLEVRENEKEIEVRLGAEILFDTGKYILKPAATAALEKLAVLVKSRSELPILIEGHTDSVGTREANLILSRNRANAVKDWLVARTGVPAARITTRGHGQAVPIASNSTADGRQRNRRVEIRLQKQPR